MLIELNTEEITKRHAASLIAMLLVLHPDVTDELVQFAAGTFATPTKPPGERVQFQVFGGGRGGSKSSDANKTVRVVVAAGGATIAPEDNPATGTASAAEVFTQGVAVMPAAPVMTATAQHTYKQYKVAGWTDDALISHGYMVAPADTQSEAAAVFGGANAPLASSGGQPPAPSNTAETSPLQSNDAATVFAAPSATPAPSAASAPDGAGVTSLAPELDKDGMPWDGRIHASTRTQTAKGEWKKRKGVDPGVLAQVTAELRNAVAAGKASTFTPLNAAPPPPAATSQVAPPPPPPAATGQAAPPPVDFVTVARFVGEHKIAALDVDRICSQHGIAGLAMLTQHKDKALPVLNDFKQFVGVA